MTTGPEAGGEWSHLDAQGRLRMVDVNDKSVTNREARAEGKITVSPHTMSKLVEGSIPKGNVFEAARLAGIQAAKKTWELIPLCHSLQLTLVAVDFYPDVERNEVRIVSVVKTRDRTGVEMEALVAVTHAALTIYDMCKALDRTMVISGVQLLFKDGGRSGRFERV